MGLIVFPTPSGIAQINPIGGLVTGAGKQAFVNKCLKIINGVIVLFLPITGENPDHLTQYVRRQVLHLYPGQDEKTGVVGDEGQVFHSDIRNPSDKLISGFDVSRR